MATPHRKPVFFPSVPGYLFVSVYLEQFQEKCETVLRPELRQNKELEQLIVP
jgi:hypothetical protein